MAANKVIVRVQGGLGNQMFCYAAARRLSLKNDSELVIDHVTGFKRDKKYLRKFALGTFNIPARLATSAERMEPFERYRRAFARWWSDSQPFERRTYLKQEGINFDSRLLILRPAHDIYLDGLWQSEAYFEDIENVIRQDLTIKPPVDIHNQKMAARINACDDAVAMHVRWFSAPESINSAYNVSYKYYNRAIEFIRSRLINPHFFLFSDHPHAAADKLELPNGGYTVVSHNDSEGFAYADMWLMSQCRHFITANSTFSWWAAWLAPGLDKVIVTPDPGLLDEQNAWRMDGMLPSKWNRL